MAKDRLLQQAVSGELKARSRQLPGVTATRVGYTGKDHLPESHLQTCLQRTGHAEAVEVDYDPAKLSYDKLLQVFWGITTHSTQPPGPGLGIAITLGYLLPRPGAVNAEAKRSK